MTWYAQQEAAEPPLLKETEQWRAQGLVIGRRNLLNPALVHHKAPIHSLKLQIFGHVCVHQHAYLRAKHFLYIALPVAALTKAYADS